MALYGHTNINIESLKRWTKTLSVDEISQVDIGGTLIKLDADTRKILKLQVQAFADQVDRLKPGEDWRKCLHTVSHMFYNAFIRIDNSSIQIADFYESLIVPSNMKTYKKIIKGFDYIDVGAIHIRDHNGNPVASIGTKSDLMWQCH